MDPIKVVITEDEELIREGLRLLVNSFEGFDVVEEAVDGQTTIRSVERAGPHVTLMDLAMPGMDGLQATREIKNRFPGVKVVALTAHARDPYLFKALEAGADGYILKKCSGEELLQAMRAVLAGKKYFCADVSACLVEGYLRHHDLAPDSPLDVLSPREREVLALVVEGRLDKQIANTLGISPKTVEKHKASLRRKLEADSTAELAAKGVEYGVRRGRMSDQT